MIITNFGRQHFKFQVGDTVFALNPVSKDGKGKIAKYGADVCLITVNHPDYNGAEQVETSTKTPYVIRGPGEYEVAGVFIKSFGTETKLKDDKIEKTYQNASYVFTFDGIASLSSEHFRICWSHIIKKLLTRLMCFLSLLDEMIFF